MNFGTPTLNKIAAQEMQNWTANQRQAYAANHFNVMDMINNPAEWLFPFIAQYWDNRMPGMDETSWFPHIKSMINKGTLYIGLFPCREWARPDIDFEGNSLTIIQAGLGIEKPDGNEDAWFNLGDKHAIQLVRLYMTDEETPADPHTIQIKNGGVVEFGTTSISKTAMALGSGWTLLRLPYDPGVKGLSPCFAILHNTNPYTPK